MMRIRVITDTRHLSAKQRREIDTVLEKARSQQK